MSFTEFSVCDICQCQFTESITHGKTLSSFIDRHNLQISFNLFTNCKHNFTHENIFCNLICALHNEHLIMVEGFVYPMDPRALLSGAFTPIRISQTDRQTGPS